MSNSFVDFKVMEAMKNSLKQIEKEVNSGEIEEIKRLVNKYDVILKSNEEEKELILKYETFYDELNENVSNKKKQINDIDEMMTTLSEFSPDDNFATIINKKKDNVNQIIDCINRIVERIKQLETTIYNNRIKELNNMKVEKSDIVKQLIKQVQIQQPIKTNDNGMDVINNSMNLLKQWSNKNTFNIIFDSDIDGDGWNNVLYNKVFKKSNLYFISFDGNNNVYGGYLDTKIDKSGDWIWITDKNAFIFSLIRNGKVNNKKYFMKQGKDQAIILWNNDPNGYLYQFGSDIGVYKMGSNYSCCTENNEYCDYEYNNDNKPLTDITLPNKFVVQRIVVIKMN
ncbi:TLDc domain-containing protein [Entamoeba marina]